MRQMTETQPAEDRRRLEQDPCSPKRGSCSRRLSFRVMYASGDSTFGDHAPAGRDTETFTPPTRIGRRRARLTTRALLLLALLAMPGVAGANLIANGSFENGTYSPVINDHFVDVTVGMTKLAGWRVDTGTVNWHQNAGVSPAQNGTKMIDLNNTDGAPRARLSQDFVTLPGLGYVLSFWLSGPGLEWPDPRQIEVAVGDVAKLVLSAPSSPPGKLAWYRQQVGFTATSTTTTLSFSGVNRLGYWGAFIDNVSVEQAIATGPEAVPEPASLGILAAALLGLGLAIRCRSQARR
jgi:choice-of-anchor C domain-containing protein